MTCSTWWLEWMVVMVVAGFGVEVWVEADGAVEVEIDESKQNRVESSPLSRPASWAMRAGDLSWLDEHASGVGTFDFDPPQAGLQVAH